MSIPMSALYVVARSGKAKRPTCQHILQLGQSVAVCGYDLTMTSREYTTTRLSAILCQRCKRIDDGE